MKNVKEVKKYITIDTIVYTVPAWSNMNLATMDHIMTGVSIIALVISLVKTLEKSFEYLGACAPFNCPL